MATSYATSEPPCNTDPDLAPLLNRLIRTANRHTGVARWRTYELAKRQLSVACAASDGRHVDRKRYEALIRQFVREVGL